ncbi:hypothetical protein SMICM17S_10531 [Streptomyces microflavus]
MENLYAAVGTSRRWAKGDLLRHDVPGGVRGPPAVGQPAFLGGPGDGARGVLGLGAPGVRQPSPYAWSLRYLRVSRTSTVSLTMATDMPYVGRG